MSTNTDAFDDVLDPRTASQADHGISARRKYELAQMDAPLQYLDQLGIEVPHKDFNPDNARQFPTSVTFENGTTVSLFQDVREAMDDSFGDMGLSDEENETVIWTVVSLANETVQITVVGDWGRRREVPFEDFADSYEPITVLVDRDGHTQSVPRLGY